MRRPERGHQYDPALRPRWPVHWPEDVSPQQLQQPDPLSCGATSVVAARVLLRPPWRPDDAAEAIRAEHRALTSHRTPRGRWQMPWPRRLGTPPWAVAAALGVLSEQRVASVHARPRPELGYEVLVAQLATRPVAVYVGSRWLPRHVVLALEAPDAGLSIRLFDPGSGRIELVEAGRWRQHRLGIGPWDHLWFVL